MSSKMNLNWNTVFFMTLPVYFRNICRYFEQFYHSFKFQAHFTLFNILFRIILCWCFSAIWYIFLILQSLQIYLYKLACVIVRQLSSQITWSYWQYLILILVYIYRTMRHIFLKELHLVYQPSTRMPISHPVRYVKNVTSCLKSSYARNEMVGFWLQNIYAKKYQL